MSSQNIYPKSCNYGCNTQIYWNSSVNEYWGVFTKKKHICPNRVNNNKPPTTAATATTNRPTYYNKFAKQQFTKPKMSNSFELLTGPSIETVQKTYEILSDIVIVEYSGRIHGSQKDRDPKTGLIEILVYYEVPLGQRDEVKNKFENFIKKQTIL